MSMCTQKYDVVVVGGGPAGMMAAGRAAERGLSVLLLEKNSVLGAKLAITGGGRCNVTNAEFDIRVLLKQYGAAEQFLYAPFSQFGVQHTIDFFSDRNVPIAVEDGKRAFPRSQNARDIVSAMVAYCTKGAVHVRTGVTVCGFEVDNGRIASIVTQGGADGAKETFHVRESCVILATGGLSHPETGSTGDGFVWLSKFGHTVHTPNPNLVPLIVQDAWVTRLQGVTLTGVKITFMQNAKKLVKRGNILCTHFGLSGPLILNSAHAVKEMLAEGNVRANIDLFPKEDIGSLRVRFQSLTEQFSNKTCENVLREWFPKGVTDALLEVFPSDVRRTKSHMLAHEVRRTLVERMKALTCEVTGTKGFDWAIVSNGGLDLREIDTRTMRSKKYANLYCIGDVLNVNRPSGGFSLQLCWTTGWVAGNNVRHHTSHIP